MTTIYLWSLANNLKNLFRENDKTVILSRNQLRKDFTDQYNVDLGRMMPWFDKEICRISLYLHDKL